MTAYNNFMQGRCFGCGSKSHTKKPYHDGQELVCSYCGKKGHVDSACVGKFLNYKYTPSSVPARPPPSTPLYRPPQQQRVAATSSLHGAFNEEQICEQLRVAQEKMKEYKCIMASGVGQYHHSPMLSEEASVTILYSGLYPI